LKRNGLSKVAFALSAVMGITEFCSSAYSLEEISDNVWVGTGVGLIYGLMSFYAFYAYQGPVFKAAFKRKPSVDSERTGLIQNEAPSPAHIVPARPYATSATHIQAALDSPSIDSSHSEESEEEDEERPTSAELQAHHLPRSQAFSMALGGLLVEAQWYFYLLSIAYELVQYLKTMEYIAEAPAASQIALTVLPIHLLFGYQLYLFGDVAETVNDFMDRFAPNKDRPHASYYLARSLTPGMSCLLSSENYQKGYRLVSSAYLTLMSLVELLVLIPWRPDFSKPGDIAGVVGIGMVTGILGLIRGWQNYNFDSINAVEGMRTAMGQPKLPLSVDTSQGKARLIFWSLYLSLFWNMVDLASTMVYYLMKREVNFGVALGIAAIPAIAGAMYLQLSEGYQSQKTYVKAAGYKKESANLLYAARLGWQAPVKEARPASAASSYGTDVEQGSEGHLSFAERHI
jgi:hypothetical protein